MRVPLPFPARPATWLLAIALVACGSSGPTATPAMSPSPRPELAWSRADLPLPADVAELAPGSSGGLICSPCHAEQASLLLGLATTPTGLLATGVQQPPSRGIAYRSGDGRAWVREPGFAPGEDTTAIAATADDAGRRVIVGAHGSSAAAWVSAGDGAWTAAPDAASLRAPVGGSAVMRAVIGWRGGFVAAGSRDDRSAGRSAAVWTSPDGLAWELVESLGVDPRVAEDEAAYGIAASADRLVVVGESRGADGVTGAAWVSDDGTTWARVASPVLAAGPMRAVVHQGPGFVAVGFSAADDRAVTWTSTDGRAWESPPASRAMESNGRPIRMTAIAAGPAGLAVAGWMSDAGNGSGAVWQSADGRAWERVPDQVSMSGGSLAGVGFADGAPVVVGTSGYPDNDQASAWLESP